MRPIAWGMCMGDLAKLETGPIITTRTGLLLVWPACMTNLDRIRPESYPASSRCGETRAPTEPPKSSRSRQRTASACVPERKTLDSSSMRTSDKPAPSSKRAPSGRLIGWRHPRVLLANESPSLKANECRHCGGAVALNHARRNCRRCFAPISRLRELLEGDGTDRTSTSKVFRFPNRAALS